MLELLRYKQGAGKRNLLKNVFAAAFMHDPGKADAIPERNYETQASPRDQREPRSPRFTMPIGSRPLDGYTIKRGIGAGGFGEVYYAKSDGGKDVALKCVQRNLDIELRGVRQCLNIKHPNLLALFDIKQDEHDQVWVIMEYVAGENLHAVLERNPNGLPMDLVSRWLDGIAAGVGHLHDCGIVHRDLKPANLFIEEGTIKIGDYGLSKFISCSRRSAQTQSVGTFHYMAPEIGQGRYGKEIDVYAIGVMLYEMLTGTVPFDGESSQEIIMKHLTAQPQLDRIPVPLRPVIARALEKDPKQRFHSMEEMRHAFHVGMQQIMGRSAASHAGIDVAVDQPVAIGGSAMAGNTDPYASGVPQWDALNKPVAAENRADLPGWQAALPDEPIAQAALAATRELTKAWNDSNLGTVPKMLIAGAAIVMIILNASWIMPYLGGLAIAYGIYLGARTLLVRSPSTPTTKLTTRQRQRNETELIKQRRAIRRPPKLMPVHMRQQIALRSLKSRTSELLGSLLCSAAVAAVFSLIVSVAVAQNYGLFSWGTNFVWLALTSTVAAWCVLAMSKAWETSPGDGLIRRVWLGIAGTFIGLFSYGLAKTLAFQPVYVLPELSTGSIHGLGKDLYEPGGMPGATAFMLFFVILFAGLRWWRQADPTRRFRLHLIATLFTVGVTVGLQALFPMPQAFLVAGISAIAIQISAPWFTSEQRKLIVQGLVDSEKETEVA